MLLQAHLFLDDSGKYRVRSKGFQRHERSVILPTIWFLLSSFQCLTISYLQFQRTGSFLAAIKDKFQETLKIRPDYGIRKCAPVDPLAQSKVRRAYKAGVLNPFAMSMTNSASNSGYDDLSESLLHEMGTGFGPRSMIEPAAWTTSCFEYGIEDRVEQMIGKRFVRCKGFNGADKTSKITLSNCYQFQTGNYLKMWDVENDPMNMVNLFFFMMDMHLKPAMEFYGLEDVPLFNSRAYAKDLKVRIFFESFVHTNSIVCFLSNHILLCI